jgi:hypothetical protein
MRKGTSGMSERCIDDRRASGGGRRAPVLPLALAALALALAPSAAAEVTATFELRPAAPLAAVPPLPPPTDFPVQLVLDDNEQEGAFGVSAGGGAQQFLWFNQFTRPSGVGLFRLSEIWVLFPAGANIAVGDAVELVIYVDPDGDPSNGATFVAAYDETVQAADDQTFSIYSLSPELEVPAGGDVLIGVVDRFVTSGVTPPTSPASLDLTASQQRSWFAVWSGDPPEPPLLPPDALLTRIDDFEPDAAGNWLIRGFGEGPPVVEVPALSPAGMAALALLLALAAAVVLRRRRTADGTRS